MPPDLAALYIAGPPDAWEALGLTVVGDEIPIGGVRLKFEGKGASIHRWALRGTDWTDIDGLATEPTEEEKPDEVEHPLGVTAIDHVVVLSDDLDRTVGALKDAGLDHRRTRDAGDDFRQAFFVIGPCLLEVGGPADPPVRFWGLTLVVDDLDAAAEKLGDKLGEVKDAVQSGRRIATVRRDAGLGLPVALMTPRD